MTNNIRFLISPWVKVRHLASKILAADGDPPSDAVPRSPRAMVHRPDDTDTSDHAAAPSEPVKGHGRNGAAAFTAARDHFHALALGVLCALCAACGVAPMSPYRDKVIIRVTGQSSLGAERHRFQQARCRLCGAIVGADGADLVLAGIRLPLQWSEQ